MPVDRSKGVGFSAIAHSPPPSHPAPLEGTPKSSSKAKRMRGPLGPLTREDGEISHLTKKEAFRIISERIEQSLALQGLCTPEPTGPSVEKPFHKGHPVTKPKLCLGLTDYQKVGAWYQICKGKEDRCKSVIRYLTDPLEEELIVDNPNLTPLFLILEELQPKTPVAEGCKRSRRFPITNSPLYSTAYRKFVVDRHYRRPVPLAGSSGPISPTRGRHVVATEARFMSSSSGESEPNNINGDVPTLWPVSPLPRVLHILKDVKGEERTREKLNVAHHTSDGLSDAAGDVCPIAVTIIAWHEADNAMYSDATVVTDAGRWLRLCDHKRRLGAHGIEQGRSLEIYETHRNTWLPVTWSDWLGPFDQPGTAILIREAGLEWCPAFNVFRSMAAHIPPPVTRKGKERATD